MIMRVCATRDAKQTPGRAAAWLAARRGLVAQLLLAPAGSRPVIRAQQASGRITRLWVAFPPGKSRIKVANMESIWLAIPATGLAGHRLELWRVADARMGMCARILGRGTAKVCLCCGRNRGELVAPGRPMRAFWRLAAAGQAGAEAHRSDQAGTRRSRFAIPVCSTSATGRASGRAQNKRQRAQVELTRRRANVRHIRTPCPSQGQRRRILLLPH
jgi:hypothetical protein